MIDLYIIALIINPGKIIYKSGTWHGQGGLRNALTCVQVTCSNLGVHCLCVPVKCSSMDREFIYISSHKNIIGLEMHNLNFKFTFKNLL